MNSGHIIDAVLRRNENNVLTPELILGISVTLSQLLSQQTPPAPTPAAAVPATPGPNAPVDGSLAPVLEGDAS